MSLLTLAVIIISAAIPGGLCIGLAFRVIPIARRSGKDAKKWQKSPGAQTVEKIEDDEKRKSLLAFPSGRRRNSSICGIPGSVLRHTDGSYTKGYKLSLSHTIYDEDDVVEDNIDDLGRLLSTEKPPGTIIQTRLNVTPDAGKIIKRHIESRSSEGTHPLAGLLHASGVAFYQEAAEAGIFKDLMLSMWVKVPAKHPRDARGLAAFLPALVKEIKRQGLLKFFFSMSGVFRRVSDRMAVRRTVNDENESLEKAQKTFRVIETQCPSSLRPKQFKRDELWDAVFRNHRQNAKSTPVLPDKPGLDIRDYICGESIEGSSWFLMHGSHPVTVVSMFVPPNPRVTADTMRVLTANPSLNFRHTIVTEYIYLDERKAKGKLKSRINQVERTSVTFLGRRELKHDARAAKADLDNLLDHVEGGRETLIETRFYAIIYGEEARNREELATSIRNLDHYCELFIAAVRKIPGADADREEPAALRAVYLRSLIGECDARSTGRELMETADSLACLIPTEAAYEGNLRPHTLLATPSGQLTGIDTYDRSVIKSPTVMITAASGEGKSVLGARMITDILDHKAKVRVKAADYYGSLRPLVDLLHGREIRWDRNALPINSWSFPGLELGLEPDNVQLGFVIGDIMNMAGFPISDKVTYSMVTTIVKEVYKINQSRNGRGRPKFEPVLSHFLDLLKRFQWKDGSSAQKRAEDLYQTLNIYRGHPLLDAPTHPSFDVDSPFDVFAIDSLTALDEPIREAVAYRIAAQIMRAIGQKLPDGTYMPLLLVFDELHEYIKRYPRILEVIEHATRMGRKEGVVTLLMSQAYEDFVGTREQPNPIGVALAKNSGVKFIGKQIGNFDRLAKDAELSPAAIGAIRTIKNVSGHSTQWVTVIGSGSDKIVEKTQLNLSPAELWTFTTDTNERDARVVVANLKPEWPLAVVIAWLAEKYPRGLTNANLTEIDTTLLHDEQLAAAA
jgi:hypothetical protein